MHRSLFILVLLVVGCAGVSDRPLRAATPEPQIRASWRLEDDAVVELSGVGDEACSVDPSLGVVCVRGLRTAMQGGVERAVGAFMPVAERGSAAYVARFRVRELGHGRAPEPEYDPRAPEISRLTERPDLQMWLSWEFEMIDRRGNTVLHLQRITPSPRAITALELDGDAAIRALEDAVLEEIGAALDGARLHTRDQAAKP